MADDGLRISPTPFRVSMQGCVVVGHGPPCQTMPPDLLRQNPDADLDVVARLKHLLHFPAVLAQPVTVDLHDADVHGASRPHSGAGDADGLVFCARTHVLPAHIEDVGMTAAFLTGDGQCQRLGHVVLRARRVKERLNGRLPLHEGSRLRRPGAAAQQQKRQKDELAKRE